jgi:uncharacterized protein YjbI with pentapeptide repeats
VSNDNVPVIPHLRQGVAIPAHVRGAPAKHPTTTGGESSDVELRSAVEALATESDSADETVRLIAGLKLAVLPNRNPPGEEQHPIIQELSGFDFSGLDLSGVSLAGCALMDATFRGSDLTGTNLVNAFITGADFTDANLTGTIMCGTRGEATIFDGALLAGTDMYEVDLSDISMRGTIMGVHNGTPVDLSRADIQLREPTRVPGSELAGWEDAGVCNFVFDDVDLRDSRIGSAHLLNSVSMERANVACVDFATCQLREIDLRGANCRGASFDQARFTNVRAEDADFSESVMTNFMVIGCNFRGAKFVNVRAPRIETFMCMMDGADFTGGNIERGFFTDTNLRGANFSNANCREVSLFNSSSGHTSQENPLVLYGSDVTGATWVGADTFGMAVACPQPDAFGASKMVALYDSVPLTEFCEKHGLDIETAGVLVWGGMLDVLDNGTSKPVTGAINVADVHVPAWVAQNYET